MESLRDKLNTWLEEQRGKVAAAQGLPEAIRSFLEDFAELDVRRQKGQLQTILQAACVYRDDRLELEFRGKTRDSKKAGSTYLGLGYPAQIF